jgi:hypothetical protein
VTLNSDDLGYTPPWYDARYRRRPVPRPGREPGWP